MQMEAAQHVHLIAIDDIEQSVGKSPQDCASHVAIDSLIESGVRLQVPLDSSDLVEKFYAQPRCAAS